MCGVRENAVRRKLLQESGLTLSKCVDICRAAEATSAQLKEMAPSQHSSEVDLVAKAEPNKTLWERIFGRGRTSGTIFQHALLQRKNCHHILPEKTNPLLH